jgi:apolipoprotein N-acyltransferase
VFRCVENRVDAVRAANTGITCFIDRTGRIVGPSGADSDSVQWITEAVRARAAGSHHTFYTRYGDWPFAFPCGILSAAVLVGSWVRERRGRKYGGEEKL